VKEELSARMSERALFASEFRSGPVHGITQWAPPVFQGASDTGRVSLVTLLCTSKESNSPIRGETNVSDQENKKKE